MRNRRKRKRGGFEVKNIMGQVTQHSYAVEGSDVFKELFAERHREGHCSSKRLRKIKEKHSQRRTKFRDGCER